MPYLRGTLARKKPGDFSAWPERAMLLAIRLIVNSAALIGQSFTVRACSISRGRVGLEVLQRIDGNSYSLFRDVRPPHKQPSAGLLHCLGATIKMPLPATGTKTCLFFAFAATEWLPKGTYVTNFSVEAFTTARFEFREK